MIDDYPIYQLFDFYTEGELAPKYLDVCWGSRNPLPYGIYLNVATQEIEFHYARYRSPSLQVVYWQCDPTMNAKTLCQVIKRAYEEMDDICTGTYVKNIAGTPTLCFTNSSQIAYNRVTNYIKSLETHNTKLGNELFAKIEHVEIPTDLEKVIPQEIKNKTSDIDEQVNLYREQRAENWVKVLFWDTRPEPTQR